MLARFPRVNLVELPTALEPLLRLGELAQHRQLFIKRDDLMSLGVGGNKLRHLEFWLGEALANDCDLVIACGLPESNQCRLTAAAAAKLDLECWLLHNTDRPDFWQGNLLLDSLFGAKSIFLGPMDEEARGRHAEELVAKLRQQGRRPYLIGNVARGTLGYVNAAYELQQQARDHCIDIKHVVMVGAMGGTASGFIYGTALLGRPWHVHVISVEYEEAELSALLHANCRSIAALLEQPTPVPIDDVFTIYDAYLGPGYAQPTPQSIYWLRQLAQTEGILLENTYTAKVLWGMMDLISQRVIPRDKGVCFWHTGGLPALFGQAEMVQPE
ncbi:MAG: 1-aminocyclopropane-1-carboxylate deaminase/D-cysteine desulfhydrase [Bacillota bacterium]|jgi:1-aminocyclopropane-1-carboxylate deaminase/D-cysteine desulfhydrase-like pyridoxal-dependent ACC family enzyme